MKLAIYFTNSCVSCLLRKDLKWTLAGTDIREICVSVLVWSFAVRISENKALNQPEPVS